MLRFKQFKKVKLSPAVRKDIMEKLKAEFAKFGRSFKQAWFPGQENWMYIFYYDIDDMIEYKKEQLEGVHIGDLPGMMLATQKLQFVDAIIQEGPEGSGYHVYVIKAPANRPIYKVLVKRTARNMTDALGIVNYQFERMVDL